MTRSLVLKGAQVLRSELLEELAVLEKLITAQDVQRLRRVSKASKPRHVKKDGRGHHRLTKMQRAAVSKRMKALWAERKRLKKAA
jgi:hypothetical protein